MQEMKSFSLLKNYLKILIIIAYIKWESKLHKWSPRFPHNSINP